MQKERTCRTCENPVPPKHSKCDTCKRERKLAYGKERYQANKDTHNATAKERYHANPALRAKAVEYSRQWRANNPEKVKEQRAQERARNKERRAIDPEFRAREQQKTKERRDRQAWGYRRLRNILFLLEKQGGKCAICGDWLPEERSEVDIDHIIPTVNGGSSDVSNLQLCHQSCNCSKGTK